MVVWVSAVGVSVDVTSEEWWFVLRICFYAVRTLGNGSTVRDALSFDWARS